MVNSDKGITNLHVPSDVIIDASMPAMIREGGKMWNAQGETQDAAATPTARTPGCTRSPSTSAAPRRPRPCGHGHGAQRGVDGPKGGGIRFSRQDVPDAQAGTVEVTDATGQVLMSQSVQAGDVFGVCQVKTRPFKIGELAVSRVVPPATLRSASTPTAPTTPNSSPRWRCICLTTTPTDSTCGCCRLPTPPNSP